MISRMLALLPLLAAAAAQDLLDAVEAGDMLEELTVSATAGPFDDSLARHSPQSVSFVPAEVLRRNGGATLGETLAWEPGVSSNAFAPGAARPVIRGFEGFRVRTLRDDLGTFDLSDISPDHGVALEPFLLEGVEIHRGPASLLYGNGAIGGAVNARSMTLARGRAGRSVSGGWESRHETNGQGFASAGHLSLEHGPWILRLTGSARDAGDIDIPGHARSRDYEALESPTVYDPAAGAAVPVPNPRGTLPDSAHDGSTWSAGISWLPEETTLLLGLSYSRHDASYGVPWIFPGDATDLYGDQSLAIAQDRVDFEGRLDLDDGFVSRIDARLARAAYRHAERFEGRGKDLGRDFTDTRFAKDAWEGRIDIHHRSHDGRLTGVIGLTGMSDDLRADRTVVPPPDLFRVRGTLRGRNFGVHALETYESGGWTARLGHRLEHVDVRDDSLAAIGHVPREKGWSRATSASLGWAREGAGPLDRLAIDGIVSLAERQPTAIERYAFWNNAGIGRFVVGGDLDGTPLRPEESLGLELALEAARGPATLRLNAYHYDFNHFIFLQEAPALTGGFGRAVQYIGRPARFTGFEAELECRLRDEITLKLMADHVRGENLGDDEPMPRMPPLRIGTRLEWSDGPFTAGLEVRHAFAQDRVKPDPRRELESASYTLVNLDASWTLPVASGDLTFFVRGTNLLDEEVRLSTSFRKDVAPLPGRGVAFGLRQTF